MHAIGQVRQTGSDWLGPPAINRQCSSGPVLKQEQWRVVRYGAGAFVVLPARYSMKPLCVPYGPGRKGDGQARIIDHGYSVRWICPAQLFVSRSLLLCTMHSHVQTIQQRHARESEVETSAPRHARLRICCCNTHCTDQSIRLCSPVMPPNAD